MDPTTRKVLLLLSRVLVVMADKIRAVARGEVPTSDLEEVASMLEGQSAAVREWVTSLREARES